MQKAPSSCHPERSEGSAVAIALSARKLLDSSSLSSRQRLAQHLLCFLLLLTIGCAVPGEPMPPLLDIPAPVSALAAQQAGTQLQVRVPVPQRTTEGTRPLRMERIELFVAFTDTSGAQPEFAGQPAKVWTQSDFPDGTMDLQHSEPLEHSSVGKRAWLAVRARNHRGIDAGLSNIVYFHVANLPDTPQAVAASVLENAIELRWAEPARSAFAGLPAPEPGFQYEIFRQLGGSAAALESIGVSSSPTFTDNAVTLGQTYRYAVRAIVPSELAGVATPLSAALEVAALDRFAPAAPENLRAIPVTGVVELAWSPNSEADLAGYNVYREQLGEDGAAAPGRKLNTAPLDISLFRDVQAQPASRYRYRVTALDRDGNQSAPSNEETIETE